MAQQQTAVFKAVQEDQRLVFAEVYAPNRPDSDGEFMDVQGVRDAAYKFMKAMKLDSIDSAHNNELVEGCCIVESFIARKGDPMFIEDAWVVGMHVDNDEMWAKIKKGEINGFSMEAMVTKSPKSVTMELPPVVSGRTMKAEDGHEHTFHVAYDDGGKFLGGKTDLVNGHFHIIKAGSITQEAAGHFHKFSHLDDIVLSEDQS